MSREDSTPDEFLRDFENTKKLKPQSNLLAIGPLFPDNDEINNKQSTVSERTGCSTHVHDYGRSFQSDQILLLPLQNGPSDPSLLGIGQRVSSTLDVKSKLADLLCDAMVEHFEDKTKAWLPWGKLLRLCQYSNVSRELTRTFGKDAPAYLDYVTQRSAYKIFVILVLIKELDKLERFVEYSYCDEDLPFTWEGDLLKGQGQPLIAKKRGEHENCFHKGEKSFMRDFHREQWQIHIPFISRTEHNQVPEYQLHRDTIMPWEFREPVEKDGGFAKVYKVKIHPDQHAFDGHDTFALKVLLSTEEMDFDREVYALRKIPPGPHVIELLATFRRGNEFSFLFPWAEGGNLAELMEQEPSELLPSSIPNASEVFARWLIEQCAGIAKGLSGMHEVEPKLRSGDDFDKKEWAKKYGIHGDLKPENILRFLDDGLGKLKLSDFGLTLFHTMATRSKQPGDGPLSPTYASPEQDGNWSFVSRKTDVWALGCVFSMLLTWAIRGPDALKEYATARHKEKDPGKKGSWLQDTFYGTEHTEEGDPLIPDGFFLKQAVIDCIDENKKAISGPEHELNYLTGFLDFIRCKMLNVRRDDRATSEEVCQFLNEKVEECYLITPSTFQGP
ncbi:hypothetical protein NW755_005179 [Fusarium falciforme]|uniref:Protein kinase domain-containing protein n=1 Tax=Fusarium falciforme TaxID=195108 RepID=A0A9W8RAY0_9HYPO|nr:hypothetical protein NW755_005179 [Fusarium falciforme]